MNRHSYQSVHNTTNSSKNKKIFLKNNLQKPFDFDLPANPEEAADILLMAAGELGTNRKRDAYTQKQIERKIRLENNFLPNFEICKTPKETDDYLFESALNECIELAKLTTAQEAIFRLFAYGLDCRRIADLLHIKHQSAWKQLRAAKIKLVRVWDEGQYAGWYEVYLSEVNRYTKGRAKR